jgi:hypothetical protein
MTKIAEPFTTPAAEATLQQVAARLIERNIAAEVVNDGEEARNLVATRLPEGAEILTGKSKTLQEAGIFSLVHESGRFDPLRTRYIKMDRQTQGREIRRLIAGPDFMLGSVNALTEDGILVAASATSFQLGPYANTAGKVILVVGSQKIVPDLDAALKRIRDYVLPWEDEQVRPRIPTGTYVGKILIIEHEAVPGRMEVILVRKPIGI